MRHATLLSTQRPLDFEWFLLENPFFASSLEDKRWHNEEPASRQEHKLCAIPEFYFQNLNHDQRHPCAGKPAASLPSTSSSQGYASTRADPRFEDLRLRMGLIKGRFQRPACLILVAMAVARLQRSGLMSNYSQACLSHERRHESGRC